MRANRSLPAADGLTPAQNDRRPAGCPEPAVQSHEKSRSGLRRHKRRGSEPLELTLVLLPMLGFLFLTLDVAWAVYTRATLQYAVAQGLRYAVTSQTMNGLGQKDSIRTVVQQNAFGRLGSGSTAPAWSNIQVNFYQINQTTGALIDVSNTVGGNGPYGNGLLPLVEVSVQSLSQKTFMPTIKMPGLGTALTPIAMSARSWDQMESPPLSGVPAL
jgi:Flp pilus assembly protein TadG